MSELQHFALTYILNSIWQVPLIALIAGGCTVLLRRGSFSVQHRLWVAALFAALLLPLASASGWFLAKSASGHLRQKTGTTITLLPDGESQHESSTARHISSRFAVGLENGVILVWLGFVLHRVGCLVWGWRRTRTIVRDARVATLSEGIGEIWQRSQERFGLDGTTLLVSDQIAAPATLGVKRAIVLLPSRLLATASEAECATVFAHESAHICRSDFLWNLLYEAAAVLIAYHPVTRLLRSRIADSRELVCDELAANELGSVQDYARSLVRIADSLTRIPTPAHVLGIFEGDNLEERVTMLIDQKPRLSKRATAIAVVGCSLLFGASGFAASAFNFQPAAIVAEELRPFAGTWHWMFKGKPFITMVLVPEGDHFSGYMTNGFFSNDADGTMIDAGGEPGTSPITHTFFAGKVLHIVVEDPRDKHSDEWTMTLTGEGKADFFTAAPDRPKNLKTWPAERFSDMPPPPDKEINADSVYHVGAGVSAPKLLTSAPPVFPAGHKEKNFSGTCILSLVVNASGLPEQVKVVRSLGPDFDQSAMDAVKQYRFEPATFAGKQVPVSVKLEVNFKRD